MYAYSYIVILQEYNNISFLRLEYIILHFNNKTLIMYFAIMSAYIYIFVEVLGLILIWFYMNKIHLTP